MLRQTKTLKKFLTIQSGFLSLFTTNSQHLIPKFHALTKTNYTNPNPIYRTNENIINNPPNIPNLPDNISSDNIEKNNTNPNFPNNDKNKNNSNDNDNEASMQVNLETFILEAQKFPLTPEEQSLPTRTYAFFSSGQSALAKNNTNVTFDIGSLTAGNLDYDIAFFMQAGDSGNRIYRVGVVLDRSVSHSLKKDLKKFKRRAEDLDSTNRKSSMNTLLKLKEKMSRVKVTEIKINSDGILVTCIPFKDYEIKEEAPTIELNSNVKEKQAFPLHNELNRIFSLINIIKIYLGYDKISAFDFSSINLPFMDQIQKQTISNEKIDEILGKILCEMEKTAKYLKDDFSLTSQVFIESRSLVMRVLFVRRKLEKIWESLEIVNRNFKMVEDNLKKIELLNKARMCLDLISYTSEKKPQDPQASSYQPPTPLWKKYMDNLNLIEDPVSKEKIRKEIERFQLLERNSGEYHKISTYLDEIFSVPWGKFSQPYWNVKSTSDILENNIYGLEKVKERILEMVAVNKLNRSDRKAKGFVILLHGPPGTGKTSIAKNIASALKRTSRLISFSGVTDSYFIKGHRRTYVDSQPGVFIKELIKSGVMNPVMILDEIDKLSQTRHGSDPYNALLEILNPEENHNFVDHYLDIKVDFSHVIFILTANEIFHILEPLKNRLEIIAIPGYIEEEKMAIAKGYILPQVLNEAGVDDSMLKFNQKALLQIIKGWCYYENGVRELKRCLQRISRKAITEVLQKLPEKTGATVVSDTDFLNEVKAELYPENAEKKEKQSKIYNSDVLFNSPSFLDKGTAIVETIKEEIKVEASLASQIQTLTPGFAVLLQNCLSFEDKSQEEIQELLRRYLGPPDSDYQLENRFKKVFPPGILNILSVSNQIGHVLKVECLFDKSKPDKKGEFSSSGNLKNVVQESLQIAKINAYRFLSQETIDKIAEKNIHVHFMSGSQPKDGPSAGIAFCTAFLSLVLGKEVPANWSMTGELSLKGEVAQIGGIGAKLIASKSLNIDQIIVPRANYEEALDLPQNLLKGLTVYFVKEYAEIFKLIFEGEEKGVLRIRNGVVQEEETLAKEL